MKRIQNIGLLIFIILTQGVLWGLAQDTQPTSIFAGDNCVAPCWFGLIVGESTAADVEQFIDHNPELFVENPVAHGQRDESGFISQGRYTVSLLTSSSQRFDAKLYIVDSVLDYIELNRGTYSSSRNPYTEISLDEILATYGMPDEVHTTQISNSLTDSVDIDLIYTSYRLRIEVDPPPHYCTEQDNLTAFRIRYYSAAAASQLETYIGYAEPQPALTGFEMREIDVPLDIWQRWVVDEIEPDRACSWNGIPFDRTPLYPLTSVPIELGEPVGGSLFENDSCVPPCWFGLNPGTSTMNDLRHLLETGPQFFVLARPTSLPSFTGSPIIRWLDDRYAYSYYESRMMIELEFNQGVLSSITIFPNQVILLQDVLPRYGQPDYVSFEIAPPDFNDDTTLNLYYLTEQIVITLQTQNRICNLERAGVSYWVESVYYHTPVDTIEHAIDISSEFTRSTTPLPMDVWQHIVNGEYEGPCSSPFLAIQEGG